MVRWFSFAVSILFLIGCSGGGGGGVGPGPDAISFTLDLEDITVEAGDDTYLVPWVMEDNIRPHGAQIRFYTFNKDDSTNASAYVTSEWATVDTTMARGILPDVRVISTDSGRVVVRGVYYGYAGTSLDSADAELNSVSSLHFMDLTIEENNMDIGDQSKLFCILFQGTQEDPVRVYGRQMHFSSWLVGSPETPAGNFIPTSVATSDNLDADGIVGDYYFEALHNGVGVVKVEYFNRLGTLASRDSLIVYIGQE